jgi:hypothetical protein
MLLSIFSIILTFLSFLGGGTETLLTGAAVVNEGSDGVQEKLIVADGSLQLDLDMRHLNDRVGKGAGKAFLRFDIEPDSFFTVVVFNNELRGALPGSMPITPKDSAALPGKLGESYQRLIIESLPWGGLYDLAVRDADTGFVFFNVEGYEFDYNPLNRQLNIKNGRLLISDDFALALKRPTTAGKIAGGLNFTADMRPIEVSEVVDGEVASMGLPANRNPEAGTVPGPDVIVGDLSGLAQFGSSSGTQVGLAVGTDSCNFGTVDLNWFANPSNDHPVIPQNLYRMSGGSDNTQRFEQIGQSSVKHAFTALTNNLCNLGCNGIGGSRLGSGCSDPYSANLNAGPNLGSRAWINPFTGAYPRNDSATPNNNHSGHTHLGPSHRILTEIADLNTSLNAGATYYAEGQYVTPHEYAWCQANPTQCNMNNNVSYRRYNVTGTASPFSFTAAAATVRTFPAIYAWTGATVTQVRPDAVNDGIVIVGHKVTNTAPGVWHYEYAIYNQNLDRGIQSFTVPVGSGVTLSNIGFRSPPQHPGWTGDGTAGNAGYSNAPWAVTQTANSITWSSETLAQNANANAIRWGTLYNFRFDANQAPGFTESLAPEAAGNLGFFKTGSPMVVIVPGPGLTPTAAGVSVAGRVLSAGNQGVKNALVTLTGNQGVVWETRTSSLGYFEFEDVIPGQTYVVAVSSKSHQFVPRVLSVEDNMTGVNFQAEP